MGTSPIRVLAANSEHELAHVSPGGKSEAETEIALDDGTVIRIMWIWRRKISKKPK